MLSGTRILIVEDEPYISMALALSVTDALGEVLGPCGSVEETFALLAHEALPTAAILDFNLSDGEVTPVAEHLLDRNVHVLFHSGVPVPQSLQSRVPAPGFCAKPTNPEALVIRLAAMISDAKASTSPPT